MTRSPIQVNCDRPLEVVHRRLGRDQMRIVVRPGLADAVTGARPGEILAWCDNEAAEGLSDIERASACRHLGCTAVELVPAQVHCRGDAGGVGGGIVNCKAWIPREEE
jgi:hypothetical protein